jgi:hypothetical protein
MPSPRPLSSGLVAMMLRTILSVYCGLCLVSLLVLGAGTFGWFGVEPDPLSGVFALMLALPWPGVFDDLGSGPAFGLIVVIAGMAINLLVIAGIGLVIRKARQPRMSQASSKE